MQKYKKLKLLVLPKFVSFPELPELSEYKTHRKIKMAIKQKNTMHQASKAKKRVKSMIENLPQFATVGIAHNNSGYFVKVHLSQPVLEIHNIPSSVEGVAVETEVVGTPRVY